MADVDLLNAGYASEILEPYLENPESVPPEWRAPFESPRQASPPFRAGRDARRRAAPPARHVLRDDRLRDRAHLRPRAPRLVAPGDRVGPLPPLAGTGRKAAPARAADRGRGVRA